MRSISVERHALYRHVAFSHRRRSEVAEHGKILGYASETAAWLLFAKLSTMMFVIHCEYSILHFTFVATARLLASHNFTHPPLSLLPHPR